MYNTLCHTDLLGGDTVDRQSFLIIFSLRKYEN